MSRYTNRPLQRDLQLSNLLLGDFYSASELFGGVSNTDTKSIVLENNSGGDAVLVIEPTARSSGQLHINYQKNVDIDTVGTELDLVNKRTDRPDDPSDYRVTTAGDGETGTISNGVLYNTITVGSGSNPSNASPGASAESGSVAVVMAGDNIALEATNESGGTQDISISVGAVILPEEALP